MSISDKADKYTLGIRVPNENLYRIDIVVQRAVHNVIFRINKRGLFVESLPET